MRRQRAGQPNATRPPEVTIDYRTTIAP